VILHVRLPQYEVPAGFVMESRKTRCPSRKITSTRNNSGAFLLWSLVSCCEARHRQSLRLLQMHCRASMWPT